MAAPKSKMTLWGDMTEAQRRERATYFVRRKGWTYRQAAEYLHASVGAIAGALARAEGRSSGDLPLHWQKKSGDFKSRWTEERLTETWEQRKLRRAKEKAHASVSAST